MGISLTNRIDNLFQEWYRLGGSVLLAEVDATVQPRVSEEVLAESTAYCRASGRLTWVVLDWFINNIETIDEKLLLEKAKTQGDLSVLGLLTDAARQVKPNFKFEFLVLNCPLNPILEPFFHRVAQSPYAAKLARQDNLEIFRRWNYISNELRYLAEAKV